MKLLKYKPKKHYKRQSLSFSNRAEETATEQVLQFDITIQILDDKLQKG